MSFDDSSKILFMTKALSTSQRVIHDKYGLGVIAEVDRRYTTIDFDEHGRKKFITDIVRLEPSDAPPPPRRRASRARAKKA